MKRVIVYSVLFAAINLLTSPIYSQEYIADYTVAKEEVLRSIPQEYIDKARNELVIAYQHTSHGTHVTRGVFGLQDYKLGDTTLFGISESAEADKLEFRDNALEGYAPSGITAIDLSVDETAFIQTTRNYLDAPENASVNVIMWSWCNIAGHNPEVNYLPGMDSLISEYGVGGTKIGSGAGQREVSVTFIRMTGHANVDDNTGPLNPKEQADTITSYSKAHQQYCLDYYSIDTHDMDDIYWEDAGDDGNSTSYGGNFYHDFQDAHSVGDGYYENKLTPGGAVVFGEHNTQHITANRKAYAMWWILARIAGWQDQLPVNTISVHAEGDSLGISTDGGALQMIATIEPVDATVQMLNWMVINGTGVASIDTTGMLTAISDGTVTVRATAMDGSGVYGEAEITITGQLTNDSEIVISYEGDTALIDTDDGTLQLFASVQPSDASMPGIAWSVIPGTGKAFVDANGLVSAQTNGTVKARATATDGSGIYTELMITITNQLKPPVTELVVSGEGGVAVIASDNGTLQMHAMVLPLDAADTTVSWSVINGTGEASVDSTGLLAAISEGRVTVRATANDSSGVYGEMQITITNELIPLTEIAVSYEGDAALIDTNDGTLQLFVSVLPADATDTLVNWSVIDETGSASIDTMGVVSALSNGTVRARATARDGSGIYGELIITIANQLEDTELVVIGEGGFSIIDTDGGSLQMQAAVSPVDTTVSWMVINGTGVASIDTTGMLTAISDGIVTVRATARDGSGVYGEAEITITGQLTRVSEILISYEGDSALIDTDDGTLQLHALVLPSDASKPGIAWSVIPGTGKAFIDASGLVSAQTNGMVRARATATDGSEIYTELVITITNQVIQVSEVLVSGEGGSSIIDTDGGTLQMHASLLPLDAADTTVSWSVFNGSGEASVDSAGLLAAISNGTVTVRATANDSSGVYGEVPITITNQLILVSDINVTGEGGSNQIVSDSGMLQLYVTVLPANATMPTVSWSVINGTGEASVDSTGLVKALSIGTVTARATAYDSSGIYGELELTILDQVDTLNIGVDPQNPEAIYDRVSVMSNRRAMQVTVTEPGLIQSITIYHEGGSGGLMLGIYDDDSGNPGSRLGVTPAAVISSSEGWQEVHLSSPVPVGGGEALWLAWVFENNPGVRYQPGTPGRAQALDGWSAGMPSDFGSSSQTDFVYSIYASYTSSVISDTVPAAPTNLSIDAFNSSSVSLIWDDNSYNETGFELERSDSSGTVYVPLHTPGVDVSSYQDLTVASEHTYYYRIRAINAFGGSDYASEVSVSTPAEPFVDTLPAAPTNLSIDDFSSSSVSLSWDDNSDNETGFELERSDSSGTGYVPLHTTGLDVSSYQDLTVAAEHTYYYRIRAINAFGGSDYASEQSVSIPAEPVGGLPFGYDIIYDRVSVMSNRRAMQVTVPEPGQIQSITIYHEGGSGGLMLGIYGDDSGSPGSRLSVTPATAISSSEGWQEVHLSSPVPVGGGEALWLAWVFENNPGVRYQPGTPGRAQALDGWSAGMPSDFGSASQTDFVYSIYASYTSSVIRDTVPAAPTNLSIDAFSTSSVSLSWDDNSYNETGFELERSDNSGTGFVSLHTTWANISSYQDLTVVPEHTYYYRIRAINAYGGSDYASEQSVSTPAVPVGGLPFGYDIIYDRVSVMSNRRAMQVTMPEPGLIQSITIYHEGGSGGLMLGVYGDDSGNPGSRLGVTPATVISSSEGWQEVSLNNPVQAGGGEALWLAWVFEDNPGVRYQPGTPGRAQALDGWSAGMPSDFGSSSTSDFVYSIYASYTSTPPAFSNGDITLGVDTSVDTENEISVYPNPTLGDVTITWKHANPNGYVLNIYNSSGQITRNMKIEPDRTEVQFNIAEYPPGMYVIAFIDASSLKLVNLTKLIKLK